MMIGKEINVKAVLGYGDFDYKEALQLIIDRKVDLLKAVSVIINLL